jgi:hypothetical protein
MSWKDAADDAREDQYDRPSFGFGDLDTGDRVAVTFEGEPEPFESEYGDGFRFEVIVQRTDNPLGDEGVTEGAATLLTSSNPFLVALRDAVGDEDLDGTTAEIIRTGEGYDTSYDVVLPDADE